MLDELTEMRSTNQHLEGLQHEAREPRLASETGLESDTKTSKCMKVAAADRAQNGDSSSARVDDGPTSLTSFGMIAEPLLKAPEKYIGDDLVNHGAEAPKSYLPPMEVCMLPSIACY